jgi:hypothetical protein
MTETHFKILAIASPGAVSITTILQHINPILQCAGLLISVVGGGVLFYCEYRNKQLAKKKLEAEIKELE